MRAVYIANHNIISSLGFTSQENFSSLIKEESGIKIHQRDNGNSYYSSQIDKDKLNAKFSEIGNPEAFTYLEKIMLLSIATLLKESSYTITPTTGLILATTKGNIDVLSKKSPFYDNPRRSYLSSLGKTIQDFFGFSEEAIVLSNACVSGVLAVATAQRLVANKTYEDVIVAGGDLVSEFIVSGFTSFQAISDEPCRPFSKNRKGITIGEAGVSALISSKKTEGAFQIIGAGSCNDANHISGPSRTGEGLYLSVLSALKEAQIANDEVDYISAHGTATNYNDEMEAIAFNRLAMSNIPINSLKGYYGHTLGASGLLETIIGMESVNQNTLIASKGFDELGVSENIAVIPHTTPKKMTTFLKTASGFGGCNTAVLFRKIEKN